MKENVKRIFVISIILSLLVSIILPVFTKASITEDTDTVSITVTGLESGVTAYLYQLTTVTYNYDSDQPQVPAYVWVEGIQAWIEENYPDYIKTSDGGVAGEVDDSWNDEDIVADVATAFYSELIASIKSCETALTYTSSATTSGTATYPVTEDECTESVTFSDLEMGTYLIIVENGYRVYTPVVVNLTPDYDEDTDDWSLSDVTADCKSTTPTITKTIIVDDEELTVDNYSTMDTISYQIITDIPTYESDSLATDYTISDVLGDGLEVNSSSIEVYGVYGNDETLLSAGETEDYTIEVASDLKSFTLDFDYDKIAEYEQIKVTYTAYLAMDSSTNEGEDANSNVATLTYSNNPYNVTSSQSQDSDEIIVYTYGIELSKVDEDDNSVTLEGAEFEVTSTDDGLLYFVLSDGVYYQANSDDDGATSTVVTDSDGMLYLYGLDEGTYTLEETKAPDGYYLAENTVTITLVDSDLDGCLDDEDETDGIYEITFTNDLSFTLPLTGGTGTYIFIILGIVLVVAGVLIIVVKRKKSKKEA